MPAVVAAAVAAVAAVVAGCGSSASADGATATPTMTSARAERSCPGTPLTDPALAQCPAPQDVRPGRGCTAAVACPSIDLLFGRCRCDDDGAWVCDHPAPPTGYDPFPDCPDDGATSGAACYLEGSSCVSSATSACFTSKVPLCICKGHAWDCS